MSNNGTDPTGKYEAAKDFADQMVRRVEAMPMAHRFASQYMLRLMFDELGVWSQRARDAKRAEVPV